MGEFALGWCDSGSTSEEKLLARRTELEQVPPDEFAIAKKAEPPAFVPGDPRSGGSRCSANIIQLSRKMTHV